MAYRAPRPEGANDTYIKSIEYYETMLDMLTDKHSVRGKIVVAALVIASAVMTVNSNIRLLNAENQQRHEELLARLPQVH